MLDIKWIRENPDELDRALASRGAAAAAAELIALDETRRSVIQRLQDAQSRRNAASKEIGQAKAQKDEARAARLMAEVASLKETIRSGEEEERAAEKALQDRLAGLPNMPLPDVPVGPDESANVELRRWGDRREPPFAREHFELGERLGLMDFEAAARLAGSRFVVLKGALARMERALGQFMLDLHTREHGYLEVQPPVLVRDAALFGTAQLPKFADDQFLATRTITRAELLNDALRYAAEDDLCAFRGGSLDLDELVARTLERAPFKEDFWLIPTAEVPLTNLVREQILDDSALPFRVTALTPCFRSEAGSAGRDTRGMLRQHQFDKVELVSIVRPEESRAEHERMTACAEEVLKQLDLAFRTMVLSTGDMGFAAQKTYDLEVWLPGQKAYREISSCSVCGEFQARRMQARYRPADGRQPRLVHTLNGSGVAVGRALIAVMETYQNEDGSITVPDVLRPYMGGLERIG
ncbi:serine--tRNA ligase [Propylenella binzhouense]|uniref:Serine--tRNA ligase n=1 Tax=Propylenella binzhouense TaxID=2555902 RepID=A0A964T2S4_9HYPH|nr:serine--tRNA ligase [Propylenella binzhouense]MYZ47368.1 serine--tRNA ligase [Propylenella binzhouense]